MEESSIDIPFDNDEELITILSIDGGGIRGVIAGVILHTLEGELQKLDGEEARIVDYFDYVAGSSTGGIVTAMLTTPSKHARPCAAKEINKFFRQLAPKIFSQQAEFHNRIGTPLIRSYDTVPGESRLRKMIKYPTSWVMKTGVWAFTKAFYPVYNNSPLHDAIRETVGQIRLADTLTNVVIPTYDINNLHPLIFSTHQAKTMESNVELADVIMSTSAAPCYFPPHQFVADARTYCLVDGGIVANNPTLFGIREAAGRMIEKHKRVDYSKLVVISVGTGCAKVDGHGYDQIGFGGLLNWFNMEKGVPPLLDVLFRASNDLIDMSTALVLGQYNSMHNFLRIQDDTLDPKEVNVNLNDATKKNIDALEEIARKLLKKPISILSPQTGLHQSVNGALPTNKEAITYFAQRLSEERRRRISHA